MNNIHNIKIVLGSLLIVLVPNIVMSLLAYWTNAERLLINIDYFIPLIFLAWRHKILFSITFIIILLLDFLVIFSQIFRAFPKNCVTAYNPLTGE